MTLSTNEPAGTPVFGTARGFAILGASAITNTGSSVLTGNLGIYPGTSITGFPPGTYSGSLEATNAAAQAAQAAALASYTDMQARSFTGISSVLDGQTLTPGVYKATSGTAGTFALAASGAGTLTLNGAGVYVFQTASTLITGAGGTPTITLTGGATAENVYWVVGSSATINSGTAGTFQGNIIAQASITDTLGGTVNGSLVALTAAVTLSAATVINSQPLSGVTDTVTTTAAIDGITFKTSNNATAVDAVDLLNNLGTADNATGKFGMLVSALTMGYGVVKKILLVRAGTTASGVFTPATSVTLKGASNTGVTTSFNVAMDIDLAVAIDGTAKTAIVELEYLLAE